MQVPILYMGHPEERLWLTDEPDVSPERQPVLIDATGHTYPPVKVLGAILVKMGTCSYAFYNAARQVGYQVVWID